jgi:hypothetical protein
VPWWVRIFGCDLVRASVVDVDQEVADLQVPPGLARLGRQQLTDPVVLLDLNKGVVGILNVPWGAVP